MTSPACYNQASERKSAWQTIQNQAKTRLEVGNEDRTNVEKKHALRIAQLRTIIGRRVSTASSALGTLAPTQNTYSGGQSMFNSSIIQKIMLCTPSSRVKNAINSVHPLSQAGCLSELLITFIFTFQFQSLTTSRANHRITGKSGCSLSHQRSVINK